MAGCDPGLGTLLTALFVEIDDYVIPCRRRRPGQTKKLSDAELVCLAVAQVLLGAALGDRSPRDPVSIAGVRVFVTGGTGAIGGHAVPALISAGHHVSALARSRVKADQLRRQSVTPVEVSLFDAEGLTEAFVGWDVVVNLATAIPPMWQFMNARAWAANQRVRTEGSAAVVDAALAAGVGRVVQESVVMLYADGADAWLDEDAPVERYPMAEGNHAAEANTRRFTDGGRTGVVLRFGWFYGPGAAHSEQMLALPAAMS